MKTLIFDFDGTLADSFELALDIAYELTGSKKLTKKELNHLRQLPLPTVLRELHVPVLKVPRLLFHGRQRMHERIDELQPFEGIPETLSALHASGHELLVISSNSEQNVRTFLRKNGLESYFAGVYGSASIFNKAIALRKILRKNGLDPANCYYVGDEVRDVVAASRVHVEPVAVTWGFQAPRALMKYHPFAVARQPSDLLAIFDQG